MTCDIGPYGMGHCNNICYSVKDRVATQLENLEKFGNLKLIREKSGKVEKFCELVFFACDVLLCVVWWILVVC